MTNPSAPARSQPVTSRFGMGQWNIVMAVG